MRRPKLSTNLLIQEDKLDATLQKSGDLLWVSPHLDQSALTRYRPIWISGTLETVRMWEPAARRGFGIRVNSKYDSCRRLLLPDEPQTPHLGRDSELWHYKLSPTPVGATSEDILKFTIANFRRKSLHPQATVLVPHNTQLPRRPRLLPQYQPLAQFKSFWMLRSRRKMRALIEDQGPCRVLGTQA